MPKKIKNCFYSKLTFSKLMEAHYRARKHKIYKNEIIEFELNLENNIKNLENNIRKGNYKLGSYREFRIYEPKERIIKALPYVDRIVHQWYVEEFIKPYIIPRFIKNTFACLENKGTHKAVDKVQDNLRAFKRNYGDFWILKCDVSKFFYSINPEILFSIMKKYINDTKLLSFTKLLIYDGRSATEKIGIPIGNYTSQYFANIYLNELDQFVLRELHNSTMVRYMDDFVLLVKNKKECIELKRKISNFLAEHLQLKLNSKSKYYPYSMGVDFCGYRIFTTHKLLRNSSKKKIKKNIKNWNYLYHHNCLNVHKTILSINSWLGHSSHCNSYLLQNKMLNSCDFLYTAQTPILMQDKLLQDIKKYKSSLTNI